MGDVIQRNNVRVLGGGERTLVFAHGFGCDQNMWRFVVPAFTDSYRVVLFDYVGAGHSDLNAYDPGRYASLEGYAQDLLEVCEALDLRDVVCVGHSVSAMISALASIAEPSRFSSLVMVGPSPRYLNDPPDYHGGFEAAEIEGMLDLMDRNYLGWASHLAPVIMGNPDQPALAEELTESFCSTDPLTARQFAEVTFFSDNRADLAKISIPCLVLQSAEDAVAPTSVGHFVAERTPRAELRLLETTGHCPHVSHPAETIAAIQDYLARH